MAEGIPPFFNEPPARAIARICSSQEPSPSLAHPEKWSNNLSDFIRACLQKEVQLRPTANDLSKVGIHMIYY